MCWVMGRQPPYISMTPARNLRMPFCGTSQPLTSAPIKADVRPTCGGVIAGKLQLCTVDGKTLTLSQYQ